MMQPFIIKIIIPFYIFPLIIFVLKFLHKMAQINNFFKIQQNLLLKVRFSISTIHQLYFGRDQHQQDCSNKQVIIS